jgi:hypothetical protein
VVISKRMRVGVRLRIGKFSELGNLVIEVGRMAGGVAVGTSQGFRAEDSVDKGRGGSSRIGNMGFREGEFVADYQKGIIG